MLSSEGRSTSVLLPHLVFQALIFSGKRGVRINLPCFSLLTQISIFVPLFQMSICKNHFSGAGQAQVLVALIQLFAATNAKKSIREETAVMHGDGEILLLYTKSSE